MNHKYSHLPLPGACMAGVEWYVYMQVQVASVAETCVVNNGGGCGSSASGVMSLLQCSIP